MELYYKDNETILYFNSIEKSENNTSYYKIDINTYTNNNIEMFGLFNNKIDERKLKKVKEYLYSPAELINIYISHKNKVDFMNRLLKNKKLLLKDVSEIYDNKI